MAVVLLNSASHNETGNKNCAYKNTDAKEKETQRLPTAFR